MSSVSIRAIGTAERLEKEREEYMKHCKRPSHFFVYGVVFERSARSALLSLVSELRFCQSLGKCCL